MTLKKDIAKAIQKADKSYFWEDYDKQAAAVLNVMAKEGYKLAPTKPTDEQIEAGVNAIPSGHVRPPELVKWIYEAMMKEYKG